MLIDLYLQGRLPWTVRVRDDRARRRRGGVREDAQRRGAAFGRGLLMPRGRARRHLGTFSLDGGTWDVDNNVWLVGDEREVVVIDAAHDADAIAAAVGDRAGRGDRVHARRTTTTSTPQPSWPSAIGAPILLHPADALLWDMKYPTVAGRRARRRPELTVAGVDAARAAHAGPLPGASASTRPTSARSSPATPCSRAARARPAGRTRDFDTIIDSIRRPAADAARRRRPCTPATATHHHRRRGPAPGGVDREGELAHGLAQDRAQLLRCRARGSER